MLDLILKKKIDFNMGLEIDGDMLINCNKKNESYNIFIFYFSLLSLLPKINKHLLLHITHRN